MASEISQSLTKNRLKAAINRHAYNSNTSNQQSSMAINNDVSALRTPIYENLPQHQMHLMDQNPTYQQRLRPHSLNHNQNVTTRSQQVPQMAQLATAMTSVPAIPGKNQRILVNKVRGVSSSKSANRIFNRSHHQGKERDPNTSTYSSFMQTKPIQSISNKSFNTTSKRFDAKLDMKELFNRDAGPGTYSISTAESSQMGAQSVSNTQGFGNGFTSKTERFKELPMDYQKDPYILVGPGTYDPQKQERHVAVPKLEAKNGFSLPFNEKNPLNYVRPITVNIYFKQANPGVGTYDPQKIMRNAPACTSVFQSTVEKAANEYRLRQAQYQPGPCTYELPQGFDLAERDRDAGTRPFKQAMPKKMVPVNLYNPHSEVEDGKLGAPGPGKYHIPSQFENQVKAEFDHTPGYLLGQTGGKLYAENNLDRFGQPILPRRPMDLYPGPGEYEPDINMDQDQVLAKGGFIPQDNSRSLPKLMPQTVPGPAYYNVSTEPKKISFMFNASDKWIN